MANSAKKSEELSKLWIAKEWDVKLLTDCEVEDEWCPVALSTEARSAVWTMCFALKAGSGRGVAALAARLLERYLAAHARKTLRHLHESMNGNEEDIRGAWASIGRRLSDRLPLLMSSCIQLAAKMAGSGFHLTAGKIRNHLASQGVYHSIEDIINSEFAVFRSLDFRLPMWNGAEASEALATAAGINFTEKGSSPNVLAASLALAELARNEIEKKVAWAAGTSSDDHTALTTLQMCAGAVLASVRLSGIESDTGAVRDKLSVLISSPAELVECVGDIIVSIALE